MNVATPPQCVPDLFRHVNQRSVARAIGRSPSYLNRVARGEIAPDVRDLPTLAVELRVDLADLTRLVAADEIARRQTRADGAA